MATPTDSSVTVAAGKRVVYGGRLPIGNIQAAIIGDSLNDPSFNISPFQWSNGMSGGRLKLIQNSAQSGTTIGYWVTAIHNSHTAAFPGLAGLPRVGVLQIALGTNNATTQAINGTVQGQYEDLIDAALGYADQLWLKALPPIANDFAAFNANVPGYNAYIESVAAAFPERLKFIDDTAPLYDPGNPGSALGSIFDTKGTHPDRHGTTLQGIAGATVFNTLLADYDFADPCPTSALDVHPYKPQWHRNPVIAGTGGTAGTGMSGTVASNLTISGPSGGITGVCSIVAADGGDANQTPWQRVAVSATTSGQVLQIVSTALGRTITTTDPQAMDHVFQVRINGVNLDNWSRLRMWLQDAGGNRLVRDLETRLGAGTQTRTLTMRQARGRPTALSSASATFYLQVDAAATASGLSGSFDFRCFACTG